MPNFKYHIAFQIALLSLLIALILTFLEWLLSLFFPLWAIAFVNVLGIAISTYYLTQSLIVRRILSARQLLNAFQQGNFDQLMMSEWANKDAHAGNELDDLLLQVSQVGHQLKSEIKRLEQIEDYRKEFLGNVTHELKTPIFAIQGFADTLKEGALHDDEVNTRFLEKIIRNTERLTHLTNDLSAISQLETGEIKLKPTSFSLKSLVAEIIEATSHLAQQNEVKLFTAFPAHLPHVIADRERIRQVLTNLIENAIKYNHKQGRVEVLARLDATKIRIAVVDNGFGIPEADISRITERFYRVDKSRSRAQGGTGLGLSIVKHILERHQTSLQIASQENKGSSFSFELPIG